MLLCSSETGVLGESKRINKLFTVSYVSVLNFLRPKKTPPHLLFPETGFLLTLHPERINHVFAKGSSSFKEKTWDALWKPSVRKVTGTHCVTTSLLRSP